MGYLALYRKYRPQQFAEVIGQSAAVDVLRHALAEHRMGHAYLFSGPRGCGKTSVARIVAKALNCRQLQEGGEPCGECDQCRAITAGDSMDVLEIDAASNRGIDEIRELRSHVGLAPFSGKYKVYIVDEVHMLTEPAFNALLKTLEEPPSHVVFLLATTEPHKVPVTIRSRCQHIPVHRFEGAALVSLLQEVLRAEGASGDEEALWELARQADGGARDALSLLEQALALGQGYLSLKSVDDLLGGASRSELEHVLASARENPAEALGKLHAMLSRGASLERLLEGCFLLLKDLWVVSSWSLRALEGVQLSERERAFVAAEAPRWSRDHLWRSMQFCATWLPRLRSGVRGEVVVSLLVGILDSECPQEREEREFVPRRTTDAAIPERGAKGTRTPQEEALRSSAGATVAVSGAPGEKSLISKNEERSPSVVSQHAPEGEAPSLRTATRQEVEREPELGSFDVPEPPEASPEGWRRMVAALEQIDLGLTAALLGVQARLDGQRLALGVPEDRPLAFHALGGGRGSLLLVRATRAFLGLQDVVLHWKEQHRLLLGEGEAERENVGKDAGTSDWQSFLPEQVRGTLPAGEDPEKGAPEERETTALERILSCAPAEVLLVRRETGAEEEPSEIAGHREDDE